MSRRLKSLQSRTARTARRSSGTRRSEEARSRRRRLRCESLEPRLMFSADLADLSVLNDEFDDPATLGDWQLVTEVEGWGAQHFETFDIDQTTPGAMTIEPRTSTWYQDYQGDLAFKEITGDFIVTTRVAITDRDEIGGSDGDDVPNDSDFSLGGVMLRSPRAITDAATQWTPGGANFVFLSLGHGYDGASMSLESKSTQDSVSSLELTPVNATSAELRVVRVGSSVTTMYRLDGDVEWQVAVNVERPDMPATLQVGLVGYTDYGKTSSFQPFYANSNTLIDTPENAAQSGNPGLAYNPDLRASFDYIRFERPETGPAEPPAPSPPVLVATEVAIVNGSFEDIAGEAPFNEFTFGPLPGWDLYDPDGVTGGGAGPQYFIGTLTPTENAAQPGVFQNFPNGASEGNRVAIAFNFDGSGDGGEYGLEQTLTAALEPDTTYSLSVDIGNIATGISVSGQTFYLDGLPGYRVELLAGGVVVASDDNSLAGSIAEGEFGESTVVFNPGSAHPQLGQPLGIRLVNLNQTAGVPAGNDLEVDFDNVRLTATTFAFQQIGDQQVHHADTLAIALAPETANGAPVAYSVAIVGTELWGLDQEFNLQPGGVAADGAPLYYESYEGYGVKWLRTDAGEGWMFLQPDGELRLWQGSIAASPVIASLGEEVFVTPSMLHDATPGGVASLDGATLTIDPADGFVGAFAVAVTKMSGELAETEVFSVDVTNTGPQIPLIGDQSLASDAILQVDLPTHDADGDAIAFEVEIIENTAADLREAFAIQADASLVANDYGYNYLGQQERWVQSSSGWMFITEQGAVHLWTGVYADSPQLARLDARYYQDPGLLVNAQHVAVSASVVDGQLQVTAANGYEGQVRIRLNATDGLESVEQSWAVEFTAPLWASAADDAFEDEDPWF